MHIDLAGLIGVENRILHILSKSKSLAGLENINYLRRFDIEGNIQLSLTSLKPSAPKKQQPIVVEFE